MVFYKYRSLAKEGPLWIVCTSPMQFCLDFLQRSKTYLKERPPSASIANRDFSLSSMPEHVVRLVYTHYKVQMMLLPSGLH